MAPPEPADPPTPRILGIGVLTGWGEGVPGLPDVSSLPGERGRGLVTAPTPVLEGDRFRRATRECLFAVAAAKAAVADAGLAEADLAGPRTGILYVSATGYAAANRAFLEDETSTTLHFRTLRPARCRAGDDRAGFAAYVNLMGGAPRPAGALWAARWLTKAAPTGCWCSPSGVPEVWIYFAGPTALRQTAHRGAACLLLEAGEGDTLRWAAAMAGPSGARRTVATVLRQVLNGQAPRLVWSAVTGSGREAAEARLLDEKGAPPAMPRLGEALAMGPLLALARTRCGAAPGPWLLTATWRSEYAAVLWGR